MRDRPSGLFFRWSEPASRPHRFDGLIERVFLPGGPGRDGMVKADCSVGQMLFACGGVAQQSGVGGLRSRGLSSGIFSKSKDLHALR